MAELKVTILQREDGRCSARIGKTQVAIKKSDIDLMMRVSRWIRKDADRQISELDDDIDRDSVSPNRIHGWFFFETDGDSKAMLVFNERGAPLSISLKEIEDKELLEGFRELLIRILSKAAMGEPFSEAESD